MPILKAWLVFALWNTMIERRERAYSRRRQQRVDARRFLDGGH